MSMWDGIKAAFGFAPANADAKPPASIGAPQPASLAPASFTGSIVDQATDPVIPVNNGANNGAPVRPPPPIYLDSAPAPLRAPAFPPPPFAAPPGLPPPLSSLPSSKLLSSKPSSSLPLSSKPSLSTPPPSKQKRLFDAHRSKATIQAKGQVPSHLQSLSHSDYKMMMTNINTKLAAIAGGEKRFKVNLGGSKVGGTTKRSKGSTKTFTCSTRGCTFRGQIEFSNDFNWVVGHFDHMDQHNHGFESNPAIANANASLTFIPEPIDEWCKTMYKAQYFRSNVIFELSKTYAIDNLGYEETQITWTQAELYNRYGRNIEEPRELDSEMFLETLEEARVTHGLPYEFRLDGVTLSQTFFAFPGGLETWLIGGEDAVLWLDTTHGTNHLKKKLALFTTVDRSGVTKFVAGALFETETTEGWQWALKQFKKHFVLAPAVVLSDSCYKSK